MKNKILSLIEQGMPGAVVTFNGEPGCNFTMQIVSDRFEGLGAVKRQQAVYQLMGSLIESGDLHAVSMKTYTPAEWSTEARSEKE